MKEKRAWLKPWEFFYFLLSFAFLLFLLFFFVSHHYFLLQQFCGCELAEANPSGAFDSSEKVAYFESQPVSYPLAQLLPTFEALREQEGAVLGTIDDRRWIEVDLSEQKLYALENGQVVYEFLISSGKPWTPTVTGDFRVWLKLRYAKMSGGSQALGNYYYLPNVPYIQYFYRSYGLHGTYWHNNFGHPMSHGCVNLRTPDAEKLFYWTNPVVPPEKNTVLSSAYNPGTRVIIRQ